MLPTSDILKNAPTDAQYFWYQQNFPVEYYREEDGVFWVWKYEPYSLSDTYVAPPPTPTWIKVASKPRSPLHPIWKGNCAGVDIPKGVHVLHINPGMPTLQCEVVLCGESFYSGKPFVLLKYGTKYLFVGNFQCLSPATEELFSKEKNDLLDAVKKCKEKGIDVNELLKNELG